MKRVTACIAGFICFVILGGIVQEFDAEQSLNRLSPESPMGYLSQGEFVLLEEDHAVDFELGVELLVRAVFWGEQHGQPRVSSSACIALAELVDDAATRRWLWDLALLLDPSRENEWVRMLSMQDEAMEELVLEASRCLYAIRYHQQPIGEELYSQSRVRSKILEAGDRAGVDRERLIGILEREIRSGLEDSCRGRLYVADRSSPGGRLVCPDHLRGLGMCANDEELRVFLRVEMALNGIQVRSWQGATSMSMDGAVKLPSVQELVRRMGVEPGKAFYRDGQWVTSP